MFTVIIKSEKIEALCNALAYELFLDSSFDQERMNVVFNKVLNSIFFSLRKQKPVNILYEQYVEPAKEVFDELSEFKINLLEFIQTETVLVFAVFDDDNLMITVKGGVQCPQC